MGRKRAVAARESKVTTKVREERRFQWWVNEGARGQVCQPSPWPLSTAVASTGKQENVYCCPSWGPISIAVFRSPPPFRLLVSAEGVQYSSRTMETSTAIPRPTSLYSRIIPRTLVFSSSFTLAPSCRYGDNQINSLRILKTLSLAPEPPSRQVVRLPIRRSRVLSSPPLGHSVILLPLRGTASRWSSFHLPLLSSRFPLLSFMRAPSTSYKSLAKS